MITSGTATQQKTPPSFLITIDTEGDNLWDQTSLDITSNNAAALPRFQNLCESYGYHPTYLVNYEMALSPAFVRFGKDILKRSTGEIGMHLHAWNSPPIDPLTNDDFFYKPYLIEFPEDVLKKKIRFLTGLLEQTFGVKMLSHRAGRWAFNEIYAKALRDEGYQIDCSVTPFVSWESSLGDPEGCGGVDYRRFPKKAYFMDLEDISKPGSSSLLELPMTILSVQPQLLQRTHRMIEGFPVVRKLIDKVCPPAIWLRPDGSNLKAMLGVVRHATRNQYQYIQFMLHSSEFMAGGSPRFRSDDDIERLYRHIEALFSMIHKSGYAGRTLSEHFYEFHQTRTVV